MGFWSCVCSFCSSVASGVVSVAKGVWEGAKKIASKAIDWMADSAEKFVGAVKETWTMVKPFVRKISSLLLVAAAAAPWPWLAGAITVVHKGIEGLLALENSPVLKKIANAIKWTIRVAKKIKETFLDPEGIEEAEEREKVFEEAEQQAQGEERSAIGLAKMINEYVKIRSIIKMLFENNPPQNFEHYLRLRAADKVLGEVEARFTSAQTMSDITADDRFMLEVASKLIRKTPELSDEDAIRLDEIVLERFDQKLIPFVFQEMIAAWEVDLKENQKTWDKLNKAVAKGIVSLRRLESLKKITELSAEDSEQYRNLQSSLPTTEKEADALEKQNRERQNYVYAAEGFLQILEKTPEELEAEGRGYLAEEGSKVGMIIIECAQNDKPWEELTEDEQSLVIDFANIYEEESKKRMERVLKVAVGA
jgi:hypothetical protein